MSEEEPDPITLTVLEVDEDLNEATMDALDLLRTVELGTPMLRREVFRNEALITTERGDLPSLTRPNHSILEAKTQERIVPPALLRVARPTAEFEAPKSYEFEGIIDEHGRFQIPAELKELLAHRQVKVTIITDDD